MTMTDLELPGARGTMPVYIAQPDGAGPWPGVVIIHDAAGMSRDLRRQADWLAEAGYLAAAPDLFYFGGTLRCLFRIIRQAMARTGDTFEDIERVRRWLADHERSTGRVGIIGFCLGGGFAVLLASGHGYDASSVNYGAVPDDAVDLLADACPIVASYGARDKGLQQDPERLREALEANGVEHDIKVYPEASHMFMNDHDPSAFAWWMVVADRVTRSGSAFHEPSAADARARILTFFDRYLKPRPVGPAGGATDSGA
jgi:carboxymethylenebutenolidase